MEKDQLQSKLEEVFEWFHMHPELSFEEVNTTKQIGRLLQEKNIEILNTPLNTGLVAIIRGKKKTPVVAIRCDIDALPINEETELIYKSCNLNKMHACGHDFHITSIIGAAYLLKERESQLEGVVKILFQPAEESFSGAKSIISSKVLEDVDAIFGLHAAPNLEVGSIGAIVGNGMAAVDRFAIDIEGIGCHAAHPEQGIDPIVTAAQLVSSLQTVVSRNVDPFDQALISVTSIHGGNTWNVIPTDVHMEGTVRTFKRDTRNFIIKRMEEISQGIGKVSGAEIKIHWFPGPPSTDNDAEWIDFAKQVAKEESLNVVDLSPSLTGEDFAFYQEIIRGAFINVGVGDSYPLHHPKFAVDKSALSGSAKLFASIAEKSLVKLSQTRD